MTYITRLVLDGFKSFGKRTELVFNKDFTSVMGPNGSGKCVTGDTLVTLSDGSLMRIDDLVNKNLENATQIDDGWIIKGNGTKILSIGKNFKINVRPIKAFVKRTAPDSLVRIITRSGKIVTSTPYHPLFILEDGKLRAIRADELYKGIRIAIPRKIEIKEPNKTFTELIDAIKLEDDIYAPWTSEINIFLREKKGKKTWKEIANDSQIPELALKSFVDKQSINFEYLIKLLKYFKSSENKIIRFIPSIKSKTSHSLCRIPWKNSPELSRLLGYLLAEGRLPPESSQIWFTNGTEELVKDYYKLITSIFGIHTTINEYKSNVWDVIGYSNTARFILEKLGMAVGGTLNKTVKNLFFKHSGKKEISELLNGLYCGDGYISKNSVEITTKSPNLAIAIENSLLRLGIVPRKKQVIKIATNSGFSGRYYQITFYGVENFDIFEKNVKLIHSKKLGRLKELLGKKQNPNVDLVEVNDVIKKIVNENKIPYSSRKLRKEFPRLASYTENACISSRFGVQQLVQKVLLKEQSKNSKLLASISNSDIFWDEVIDIEYTKPKDPWVYDLCVEKDHNFIANNIFVHNSNILDSLCFVLGKSSSKSLRAEKSANLIYNGGKTKQPAKSAEVSIFFDNTNATFPLEEKEIKISRIVRHDGSSRYLIDGKTRTRQEVVELLSIAKIDPDGYNIILQGDIVQMVEMSPIERRQLMEDIAGIGVYEEKKNQALNELTKVDQKIGEAEIVLKEREGYLKDLKKDRDHALKYKELSDNIKKNKASYLKIQINKKNTELEKLNEKSSKYKEKLEKLTAQTRLLKEEITERKKEIDNIAKEIESKGNVEQIQLQKQVETLRVALATCQEKISNYHNEINKIKQRKQQLDKEIDAVSSKLNELEAQKNTFEETKQEHSKELQFLEKKLTEFKAKHGLDTATSIEQEIEVVDKKCEEIEKQIHSIREHHQISIREKDKIEFQLQTIDTKIEKIMELEKAHKGEIEDLKRKRQEFKKTVLELNDSLNKDSTEAKQLAEARNDSLKQKELVSSLELKNASVQESINSNISIKKILENKKTFGEVYGTISELGNTSSKYALALEVAAGQKIHSIVVEDDKTAEKCIKYLRTNKLGVATFLPLNKIKPFTTSKETEALRNEKEIHGLAIDLISFDKKFRDAFSYVFGNTLIVESIETARKIGIGKARMVSIEGDLTELSGAMVGGFRHKKIGSFREREVIEKLENAKEELEKLEASTNQLEISRAENDKKITNLRELKAKLEGDIIKTERALHLDSTDLAADQEYKDELQKQLIENDKKIKELENVLEEHTGGLTTLKIQKQQLRNKISELRKPTLIAELNAFEQKKKALNEEIIKIDTELKNTNTQINETNTTDKENALKVLKENEKEKELFEKELEKIKKDVLEQEKILKQKEKEQEQFYSQFKNLFDKRNKLQDEINTRDGKILVLDEESRREELELNSYSIEEARINAEVSAINAEFAQYEGIELDDTKTEDELRKEILAFEKIMANIGSVNMRALEIYDVAVSEHQNLLEKKDSLTKEKESVLKMMNEIETSKKGLFMKTFEVINKNFKEIFLKLSSKGDAYLEIENPENIFESGLMIKVKLTGEKFLDIRSLSGGEKTMTALAFIFSIQEHEPASFYILDEVDAALDKHNSTLLAKLIRQYCSRAQYIVISHNDAVISEADVLYGVSMKPDTGLSQIVSLRISSSAALPPHS